MFRRWKYNCRQWSCSALGVIFLLLVPADAHGQTQSALSSSLKSIVSKVHGAKIGVFVADTETRAALFAHRDKELLIPASVVKIVTSYAALKLLGSEYQFQTEFFVDRYPPDKKGSVGALFVRGYGDPTVVDETIGRWVRDINARGVKVIERLVLDDSLFIDPPGASGRRPYQAGLGALSLNHNCYRVMLVPGKAGTSSVVSLTPGAPFSSSFEVRTAAQGQPAFNINQTPASQGFSRLAGTLSSPLSEAIAHIAVSGRLVESQKALERYFTVPDPTTYFAYVLKHHLMKAGIKVGEVFKGEIPSTSVNLVSFQSPRLREILVDLNHYSNNFIANQLLFALGQDSVGYFRMDQGIERINKFLLAQGFSPETFDIADGSGLSRQNQLSARMLGELLLLISSDFTVYPYFAASLSRYGSSGTLKKRKVPYRRAPKPDSSLIQRANSVWGKTGTLTGVSTLAGYAETADSRRVAYAIIVNNIGGKVNGAALSDQIVAAIISNSAGSSRG